MALNLNSLLEDGTLAPDLSQEIFSRVYEQSAAARLAKPAQMSIKGNTFLIDSGRVEADIVEEGQAKPVSNPTLGFVKATPIKAAVITTWTKEFRLANPARALDLLRDKLVEAINEQVDAAVFYGRKVKSKSDIDGVRFINETANRVTLGTAPVNEGGIARDIMAGYDLVLGSDKAQDFTAFAADPRFRSTTANAVDANGRPISTIDLTNGGLNSQTGSLYGLPVAYSRSVSGRYGIGNPDTGVRAFGGDYGNALRLGFVEDISVKMTDVATVDGVSLWQTNQEAILAEAIFSYVVDPEAFVAYETTPAGS